MFYSECQPGNQIVPPPAPGQGRTGRTAPSTTTPVPREARQTRKVRPAGIEPAACGLKDRCSLAPRREPLTTELRARAVSPAATPTAGRAHNLSRLRPAVWAGGPDRRPLSQLRALAGLSAELDQRLPVAYLGYLAL